MGQGAQGPNDEVVGAGPFSRSSSRSAGGRRLLPWGALPSQIAPACKPTCLRGGAGDCDAGWWNARAAALGWHGAGAHRLGASISASLCAAHVRGRRTARPTCCGGAPGWGELEFECVELAMRFMAQIYGVVAVRRERRRRRAQLHGADGGGPRQGRATARSGTAPLPGDVISFDSPGLGHVAVVTAASVDAGGQRLDHDAEPERHADGWRTLAVSHWKVASFGDQVPYGWLHDPSGRGRRRVAADRSGLLDARRATAPCTRSAASRDYGHTRRRRRRHRARRDGARLLDRRPRGQRVTRSATARTTAARPSLRAGERVTHDLGDTDRATATGSSRTAAARSPYGDAHFYGDMSRTRA